MTDMIADPVHQFAPGKTSLLATFHTQGAVTHVFESRLGDGELEFQQVDEQFMRDRQTVSYRELVNGNCVKGELTGQMLKQPIGIMSFRKAWENFHRIPGM